MEVAQEVEKEAMELLTGNSDKGKGRKEGNSYKNSYQGKGTADQVAPTSQQLLHLELRPFPRDELHQVELQPHQAGARPLP